MNIDVINEMIDELEQSDVSLSNIRNLSALYNVRTHILGTNKFDASTKELSDILPSYLQYIETKKRYQLQQTTVEYVCNALESVCNELTEFIQSLYSCTDTEQERSILERFTVYYNKK